jgi:Protein of unknown function (DUF4127)
MSPPWRRLARLPAILAVGLLLTSGRGGAQPSPPAARGDGPAHSVALVPVDDRPVNLQDVELAARTADVELVTPPGSRLGGRDIEGDADGIVEWLDGLDVATVDALVVSIDMLAYGGASASREPATARPKALARLGAIERVASRRKDLPVLAYGTLLPLAPAPEPKRAVVLGKLERWAALAGTANPAEAAERDRLREELPALVLTPYLAVRDRNTAVTMGALDLVRRGAIAYCVLEAEEPAPRGLSAEERAAIEAARSVPALEGRTALVAATDGISALLVTRAVNMVLSREPGVQAEGQGSETLAGIAGAHPVARAGPRDLVLQIVSAPNAGTAADAATLATQRVNAGARLALADITGGSQAPGSSIPFIEALRNRHVFPRLLAYAAEGAADPTIAAAVSQGLLAAAGLDESAGRAAAATRLTSARMLAMLHRLVVDFVYQAIVRPQAAGDYASEHRMRPDDLDADQVLRLQDYLSGEVKPLAESLVGDVEVSATPTTRRKGIVPIRDIDGFHLTLPWRRMADPEIRFTIVEH